MARDIGTPVWNEKKQYWQLGIQRDGKRKWFYCSTPGKKGQRECEDKAAAWLAMDPNESNADPLIADVYAEWVQETHDTTSVEQSVAYESYGRLYILPAIGRLHMSGLHNEQQLQKIINDAFKSGVKGKPLSKKSLMTLKSTITAFLKYCRKRGLTLMDPENLDVPKRAQSAEKKILQPDDLRILFASDQTTPQYGRARREWFIHAFRLQVLVGLRPGEALGLKQSDIKRSVIHVSRSLNVRGEWTDGKNANAHRKIPLSSFAAQEVAAQIAMLKDADLADCPYLFPDPTGEPAREGMYRKHLKSYCKHNGIADVTPYELRHTFISINQTLPIDVVKKLAGHSESMDTFGVYGHEVDGDVERTAIMLDDIMSKILLD